MATDPLIGRQLANYRAERVIGRGGMAQVYYGWDVKLNRPVALKVIDARYRGNPEYARRFVQEAQAVAGWRHENVIQIYYADDEAGLYYYAMEYIDGEDLAALLAGYTADGELIPHADVVRLGRAIASALDYAHQRGVIHRDVKPSNVMVARDGRVVLGDFGLALDVQQGSLGEAFGSPHYMAPEQARRSTEAVPQSDLYSLGVILYEMLTGSVPFDDPSPTALAVQHMTQPPPPPRSRNPYLNAEVEGVLLKALNKRPELRYPTGHDLMVAAAAALAEPAAAPMPGEARGAPAVSRVPVDDKVAQTPVPGYAARTEGASAPSTGSGGGAQSPGRALRDANRQPRLGMLVLALAVAGIGLLVCVAAANGLLAALRRGSGRPVVLLYDNNSFQLANLGQTSTRVAPLAFERLDASGAPAGRFEGRQWAAAADEVEPGWCLRLQILDSGQYTNPPECVAGYRSTLVPARGDPAVFWTALPGSDEFRVLWDDREVGRCAISAGLCRVVLP